MPAFGGLPGQYLSDCPTATSRLRRISRPGLGRGDAGRADPELRRAMNLTPPGIQLQAVTAHLPHRQGTFRFHDAGDRYVFR